MTRLSVVIPSWNTRELLRGCLCSLEPALPLSCEVIVVDNGSQDGSARMVATEFPHVRLVRNERNEGWARAVNQGMERTHGEYVLLLHADTELESASIKPLLAFLDANERYGAVVPRVLNPNGSIQRSVMALPNLWTPLDLALGRWIRSSRELARYHRMDFDYGHDEDVDHASSACFLVRRKALRKQMPVDEDLNLFFGDVDLCRRLRTNSWKIRYLTQVQVFHHGGRSLAHFADPVSEWHKNRLAYYRKHHGRFAGAWVKACVGVAFTDHLVGELWRRAHGLEETSLWPAYETLTVCLRC